MNKGIFIPNEILENKLLRLSDKIILSIYKYYTEEGSVGCCMLTNKQVGEIVRLSSDCVAHSKVRLKKLGLIKTDSGIRTWYIKSEPDGQITIPYGQITIPDGQITIPYGQITIPYGQITIPDGQITIPDGQITIHNKEIKNKKEEKRNNKEIINNNFKLERGMGETEKSEEEWLSESLSEGKYLFESEEIVDEEEPVVEEEVVEEVVEEEQKLSLNSIINNLAEESSEENKEEYKEFLKTNALGFLGQFINNKKLFIENKDKVSEFKVNYYNIFLESKRLEIKREKEMIKNSKYRDMYDDYYDENKY